MSTPTFLDVDYCPVNAMFTDTGVTDVATCITTLRTLLVTNLSWTEPSTALFTSPVDVDGRFMDILVTRISATSLEFRLRDQNGITIFTRRIQISGAGTAIHYFTGKYYCVVESMEATPELFQAYILEQAPDEQADSTNYVVGNAYRNGAGAADGQGSISFHLWAMHGGTPSLAHRTRALYITDNSTPVDTITQAGTYLFLDPVIYIVFSGTYRIAGRLPMCFAVPYAMTLGSTKSPAVDDNTFVDFYVLNLPNSGVWAPKLAIRKGA